MSKAHEFNTLEVAVEGPVVRLRLNRPEKLNPLSPATLLEIAQAAQWFDRQEEIKVVIVSGNGRCFSAGADLAAFKGPQSVTRRTAADYGRRMAAALETMRPLAIAAIHGWCIGGAVVLAAACDLRVASVDARFSIPEVDLGIPLAWGGIPRLVREIGPALTKELVITCREFSPQEAASAGFLNRVVPSAHLEREVDALADSIASKAMLPVALTKCHVNAVTAQATGIMHSWSDADSLLTAFSDPECNEVRNRYLTDRGR